MRKAILDLGTNTFHLLIGEVKDGMLLREYEEQLPVKIGKGGIEKGLITEEAQERALKALTYFRDKAQSFGIGQIKAIGTSAIRNALNGHTFIERVRQQTEIQITSIDGDTEASLIFKGVMASMQLTNEPVWVMDIGGGSVEFILGKHGEILWKKSYEIGAARLLEKFNPEDPIEPNTLLAIENYLRETLQELKEVNETLAPQGTCLLGAAGSFDTLREMLETDLGESLISLSDYAQEVSFAQLSKFYNTILPSTEAQRKQMSGLPDFRVDMIVVATCLMKTAISLLGSTRIIASHFALKEGLLLAD